MYRELFGLGVLSRTSQQDISPNAWMLRIVFNVTYAHLLWRRAKLHNVESVSLSTTDALSVHMSLYASVTSTSHRPKQLNYGSGDFQELRQPALDRT